MCARCVSSGRRAQKSAGSRQRCAASTLARPPRPFPPVMHASYEDYTRSAAPRYSTGSATPLLPSAAGGGGRRRRRRRRRRLASLGAAEEVDDGRVALGGRRRGRVLPELLVLRLEERLLDVVEVGVREHADEHGRAEAGERDRHSGEEDLAEDLLGHQHRRPVEQPAERHARRRARRRGGARGSGVRGRQQRRRARRASGACGGRCCGPRRRAGAGAHCICAAVGAPRAITEPPVCPAVAVQLLASS